MQSDDDNRLINTRYDVKLGQLKNRPSLYVLGRLYLLLKKNDQIRLDKFNVAFTPNSEKEFREILHDLAKNRLIELLAVPGDSKKKKILRLTKKGSKKLINKLGQIEFQNFIAKTYKNLLLLISFLWSHQNSYIIKYSFYFILFTIAAWLWGIELAKELFAMAISKVK